MDQQFYNYTVKGDTKHASSVQMTAQKTFPKEGWQFKFALPGPYTTQLSPELELRFSIWIRRHHIPFDPGPNSDYDMRGYFLEFVLVGDDGTKISKFDGRRHFPDTYKTPFHKSFSRESKYANSNAPAWNAHDQLVGKDKTIYWDEKADSLRKTRAKR